MENTVNTHNGILRKLGLGRNSLNLEKGVSSKEHTANTIMNGDNFPRDRKDTKTFSVTTSIQN